MCEVVIKGRESLGGWMEPEKVGKVGRCRPRAGAVEGPCQWLAAQIVLGGAVAPVWSVQVKHLAEL